ncbi:MAG: 4,5-dioxygenase [Rhodospirillaceae bacterium]|nr:4,5-dioxygenase [Rhodospirillaceae bacterium]
MISHFHAHIYYEDKTRNMAKALRISMEKNYAVEIGRWREEPVGPHPQAMYQVSFQPCLFGTFVPWLMLNRTGLSILVHPNTESSVLDHTKYALWMGKPLRLRLKRLDP